MHNKSLFAFTRINFIILGCAIFTILIGFILMSGGGSTDTHFDPSIFDTQHTVIAPMICFFGYLLIIVAILYRPKRKKDEETGIKLSHNTSEE